MLNGKSILITGIATDDSIATATLRAALRAGARVRATALPRDLDAVRDVVSSIDPRVEIDPLDFTDADAVSTWTRERKSEGCRLDGALHAIAFAPRGALDGAFLGATELDVTQALRTSVWTYAVLARVLDELRGEHGASLVGLDFDAGGRAWPIYNWMGVCKAALRESSRYVARDLGPRGVRSNLIAAGPLLTRAARGIPRFELLTNAWEQTTPMAWDPSDASPVADVACFLLSDLARAITGELIHVDGGFNAMAMSRGLTSS
ncbi:MAG: SDR family oxidoreductase [Acidobacteriota bacterium]|nr:SDR family oxidoreductase [Acidobacteriota bacterium]